MIVDLPDTSTSKISKSLVRIREQGGAVALGRVLTLIIATTKSGAEVAIAAANSASREHPCRIIVLITDDEGPSSLDAEIRVGGDAGASEVIVLKPHGAALSSEQSLVMGLLLPDAPVVAWWPNETPSSVAESELGKIATRRITDSMNQQDPTEFLRQRAQSYAAGDSDLAWTRLTLWRSQLAAVLDQAPFSKVQAIELSGNTQSPSVQLLAAWLRLQLGCQLTVVHQEETKGIKGVHVVRFIGDSGEIEIRRERGNLAALYQSGQPPKELSLPVRSLRDCLAEDLRRLDPDNAYHRALLEGFSA